MENKGGGGSHHYPSPFKSQVCLSGPFNLSRLLQGAGGLRLAWPFPRTQEQDLSLSLAWEWW